MTGMPDAIRVRELSKKLGNFTLGPIDLTLPEGCVMGLIGENGAGKSTLISLLTGLKHPDSGECVLLGEDDWEKVREDVGIVLDIPGFPSSLTADEIGTLVAPGFADWDAELYARYCREFALPEKTRFGKYSRGMKMKLSVAVALAHHPRLLILDEPTGGLDPVMRDEILDLFYEFIQDGSHSILISSHILSDLEKICDYISFIHQGKILLSDEKDKMKEEYGIFSASKSRLESLGSAVKAVRETDSVCEALVLREYCPEARPATLEELMVFLLRFGKGESL